VKSKIVFLTVVSFLFFAFSSMSYSNSVWNNESSSPYSTDKSYKVGDIITVMVMESTNAQQKSGTNTSVSDNFGIKFTHTIQKLNPLIGGSNDANFQGSNKYAGTGTTQRASSVTAKVATVVTEVLENGNLKIEGVHRVDVNDESQDVMVSGVIRSKDVTVGNTIYSYQIANASVSVKGTGVVQEAESPGWLTRILNWLF